MHLQCFTHMRYVVGVVTCTYNRDDHYPILSKLNYGCMLALCGPTMHVATTMWRFPDNFFFFLLNVHSSLKKKSCFNSHSFIRECCANIKLLHA